MSVDGAGGGAGFRGSFRLLETTAGGWVTLLGGVLPPGAKTPCGTVFARGLGAWILVVVCLGRGGSGSSSDSDSDDDDDDSDESEDSSFSSRNSNTLGVFAGSAGLCGGFSGSAGVFRACLDRLACCEGELFSAVLGVATGPACAVVLLDTNEYVLFLASFFGFLVWSGMVIGEVRSQYPVHTSSNIDTKSGDTRDERKEMANDK